MSRLRPFSLALVLLSVLGSLLAAGPATAQTGSTTLPLASIENWSVLLLDGGILYTRVAGSQDGPFFVFAAPVGGSTTLLAYRGGADAPAAFGALDALLSLSSKDDAKLKAFALGNTSPAAGSWDALTFGDGYVIAADPALGQAGPRLYSYLLVLEAAAFAQKALGSAAAASSKDAIVIKAGACSVQSWTAWEVDNSGKPASSAAASGGSGSFPKVLAVSASSDKAFHSAAVCAGDIIPERGVDPAFPIAPGTTYPTAPAVPIKWTHSACSPPGITNSTGCMNHLTGAYCPSCTCEEILNGQGQWIGGNCAAVTVTPDGSPCGPNGGRGPCSVGTPPNTKTCDCKCTSGAWKCGSAELAIGFALLAAVAVWRRRLAC